MLKEIAYCVFCDAEAKRFVRHKSGQVTPLCRSHAEAYMSGQACPEAPVAELSDDERERVIRQADGLYFMSPF